MGCRVEIWGWKERDKVERVHERFLRWVLGVKSRTLGYMITEKRKKEK